MGSHSSKWSGVAGMNLTLGWEGAVIIHRSEYNFERRLGAKDEDIAM